MSENAEDTNSESQLQINAGESSQPSTHRDSELLVCDTIYIYIHIYMCVCVYICVCMCVCVYMCVCVCVCLCVCVFVCVCVLRLLI